MSYTAKCLGPSGVGIMQQDGQLSLNARNAFTSQVIALLTSGNQNGTGAKISSLTGLAFPPPSGVKLLDPDKLITNPTDPLSDLFWFAPSPVAALTFERIQDRNSDFQKIIVDGLYTPLMNVMNLPGNAVAPPILDYTGLLPPDVAVNLSLPDLPKIAIAIPGGLITLGALGIDLGGIPSFLANIAAIVPMPSIPQLPNIPIPKYDFDIFPKLFGQLLTMPVIILPKLIGQLASSPIKLLTPSPPELFGLTVNLVFDFVLDILKTVGLLTIMPKLLVSAFIVMIQNATIALLCMAVSQIIGTGLVIKTIGQALGLA